MQFTAVWAALALAVGRPCAASRQAAATAVRGERVVSEVVTMLEGMLAKSKADEKADREVYAKLKCYCRTQEGQKTQEIAELTQQISLFESTIDELQSSNGQLSSRCAKLQAEMSANDLSRRTAQGLRNDQHQAFLGTKADLTTAIGQMNMSIEVLAEVGADQSLGDAAEDHTRFMAGFKPEVRGPLMSALAFLKNKLKNRPERSVQAFLQKPFTGNYAAQSGEVVGILKNMRDRFLQDLYDATATEARQQAAHDKFMKVMLAEYVSMSDLYDEKQALMSKNDIALAMNKGQLTAATEQKGIRQDFLAEMLPMCEKKAHEYQERNMLRSNEEAAISEAIAILDKDSSFATFGTVEATSKASPPALLQMAQVGRHRAGDAAARLSAQQLLQAAANSGKSLRLAKIVALLEAGPFDVVLKEIVKMLGLIEEEGKLDKQKLDWCNGERERSRTSLQQLGVQKMTLTGEILALTREIEAPEVGLKAQIASTEVALQENSQSQKDQTAMRKDENLEYQRSIANTVEAERLLESAIKVLRKYYSQLPEYHQEEEEKVQTFTGETKARPDTWEKERGYKGQSNKGTTVIGMLEFILSEAKKEEAAAHSDEESAQHAFEDSMQQLKGEEKALQTTLATLQRTLAEKEQELLEKKQDLKATKADIAAVEQYLVEIKPGCDFITQHFSLREGRRAAETAALQRADTLLRGTPAYIAGEAAKELESLGQCKDTCVKSGREHVECKACLARVTVPGYCAGHAGTEGC